MNYIPNKQSMFEGDIEQVNDFWGIIPGLDKCNVILMQETLTVAQHKKIQYNEHM